MAQANNATCEEAFHAVIKPFLTHDGNANTLNPEVISQAPETLRHILLTLQQEGFYTPAALAQAVHKSFHGILSRSDKSLLKEAKTDDYYKVEPEKRAKEYAERVRAREERAAAKKAKEERQAEYLRRKAVREAAERQARGQYGYVVEGGVTKIGRNYM